MKKDAGANAPRMSWAGPALVLALLLAGCLPASAQNLILSAGPAPLATPAFSAQLQAPPLAAALSYPDPLAMVIAADYRGRDHDPGIGSTVDYVKTPFVEQNHLPVARFFGGRFELGGFNTLRPMENVLLGPPALNAATKAHPGIRVPLSDESYGLSLSIRLKRHPAPEHQVSVWRCLGWVVGGGRGCRLN